MTSDLREELGLRSDPEFDIELPSGWTRSEPDQATLEATLRTIKQRMMEAHRPEIYGQIRTNLTKAFEEMRRNGVFAYFAAFSSEEDTLYIPASMTASIRYAGTGESLDDLVRGLIQHYGAKPLRGDMRTVRTERENSARIEDTTVINHYVTYLTPIPGAKRRRALQLVASFARKVETPSDSPAVVSMRELFDASVATLRWRPAAGE